MTISYYNQNASDFVSSSLLGDLSPQYEIFMQYLKPDARILDLGCGSGRDSKYFIERGYAVEAADGSPELCRIAGEYLGKPVKNLMFQDMDYTESFDAVWACSSLLHVPPDELPGILSKVGKALKPNGIFYMSFKYGSFSGERYGRWFTDLNEQTADDIVGQAACLTILRKFITNDSRPGRGDEKWLNIFMQKIN